jgi:predicted DNA binding CopG/RHH family protein
MKKKVPHFKSDEEAEAFLEQDDLSDYLHAGNFAPMHFEIRPKEKSVNLRMSEALYDAVRETAKDEGVPYQRYIRHVLERAVSEHNRTKAKAS